MNEAANDSARVSGQDRQKPPALATNQIARFGEFRSLASSEKNKVIYEPTKGSSYTPLPAEFRNSTKGFVNMKNDDNECFCWCHIRYLNPQEDHPYRIKQSDKRMLEDEVRYLIVDFKSQKWSTVYRRRVEDNFLHTAFTQCYVYITPLSYKLALIFVPEPSNVHANSYPHRGTRGGGEGSGWKRPSNSF